MSNPTRKLPVWADVLGYWVPKSPWRRAWAETRSISEHGDLVARWLEGEYRHVPGHYGPPAGETAALVPDLIRLNRSGLVTVESQPGATGEDRHGRWTQRAYLYAYGSPQTITHLATAALAAGLWVRSTVDGQTTHTFPDGPVALTFDPDTDQVFTGDCGGDDTLPVWDPHAVAWHPDSRHAWQTAARITVIDPEPARQRLLWDTLTAAIDTAAATR